MTMQFLITMAIAPLAIYFAIKLIPLIGYALIAPLVVLIVGLCYPIAILWERLTDAIEDARLRQAHYESEQAAKIQEQELAPRYI